MKTNLPKSVKFGAAVAVQLAIVAGLVVFNAAVLARGTEIILPIEPVDPRDPLRGDYITVDYGISTISSDLLGNGKFKEKDIIYTILKKEGDHWVAGSVAAKKPAGGIFIRGNVKYVSYYSKTRGIDVVYGIEDYFIPEGTGANLGQKMRDKNAFARVVVDKNGNAILKDIFFKDKPSEAVNNIREAMPIALNQKNSADDKRKKDIALIQGALEKYYQDKGEYPLSGGAGIPNADWSISNGPSWNKLQKALNPYLEQLPVDPVNDQDGWPGDGDHAYGYFSEGYGCPQQWYMLVARYEGDENITSPGITACDGEYFDYPGTVTVGVCKGCGKTSASVLPPL